MGAFYRQYKAKGFEALFAAVNDNANVPMFVQQYQVTVDPAKLKAYGIPLMRVAEVIRNSNRDVGGRTLEMADAKEGVAALLEKRTPHFRGV